MKKIFFSMALLAISLTSMAQAEYLPISVVVADVQEPFPAAAKVQIQNKLNQLLTKNGIASLSENCQFVLTAFAVPQTKDIIAGAPVQYAESMDITFYIADVTNQNVFATTSQKVKGVGTTDAKCYMECIKAMNINSPAVAQFVADGKAKIIAYYDAEGSAMLKKAEAAAAIKHYEEAMYLVSSIPSQCKHFDKAQTALVEYYKKYVDHECHVALAEARTAWMAEQNAEGARLAGESLARIYPDAACYADAMALYKEIKGKVLDDWKFEMKQYDDQIDVQKYAINAAREIGVAYGNHQQPTTTNIGFLRGLGL